MEVRLYKVVRTELSFLISGVRAFCLYCKIIRSCLNSLCARWRITPVWKVSRTSLTAILAIGFLNSLVMRHQVTSDWICNVCLKKKKIPKGPPWFLRNCGEKEMVFFPSNSEAQSMACRKRTCTAFQSSAPVVALGCSRPRASSRQACLPLISHPASDCASQLPGTLF